MSSSNDRLKQLESIEVDLAKGIQSAGQAIQELSKDKPSMKQVETHSTTFLKTLERVEGSIGKQIQYLNQVSTGQAHEGSAYASQKVLNMAWHRLQHSKTQIHELDTMKLRHLQEQQNSNTQNGQSSTVINQNGQAPSQNGDNAS
ncbi:Mediator of RNA polymerase II transcription subunit 11 [Halotydeus destructor]|nr:Mediator of RNA polymerase II transcription subunit 11 [Halotydeus destructor]